MKNVGSFTFILVANVVLTLLRYNLKTGLITLNTEHELAPESQSARWQAQQYASNSDQQNVSTVTSFERAQQRQSW